LTIERISNGAAEARALPSPGRSGRIG
jgi:hypothetical protein